ncbi:MAG: hypothetical protein F4221_01455 [Rhodothermaceae bacterium]|nr:hypothetical protein [Rhodothermaceae bacterium]
MNRILITLITLAVSGSALAQENRTIDFPDVPGYYTLTCDLHMHTVFSDGSVWPNIRVQEAHRDGLDAIAIPTIWNISHIDTISRILTETAPLT